MVISDENRNFFPTPVYITSPLRGFPLEFCNGGGVQKTNDTPTGSFWRYIHLFRLITGIGQTDGQNLW